MDRKTGMLLRFFGTALLATLAARVTAGAPAPGLASFRFVVAADPHLGYYKNPALATGEFARTVLQINDFAPDFVVFCGDMISTYSQHKTDREVETMWDEFDACVAPLKAPYRLVPGNHDINTFAGATERSTWDIYARRYGKTYYSFDYRQGHFIVLNCEVVPGTQGMLRLDGLLDEAQLQWLEADLLLTAAADPVFVFIHQPGWQDQLTTESVRAFWRDRLHPLFARHGVDAVFAGHLHRYGHYGSRDGVTYYVLANCGGGKVGGVVPKDRPRKIGEADGAFRHFLLVEVTGGSWTCKVAKRGGLYPDAIVRIGFPSSVSSRMKSVRRCGPVSP